MQMAKNGEVEYVFAALIAKGSISSEKSICQQRINSDREKVIVVVTRQSNRVCNNWRAKSFLIPE
jgi:hypothetical protein